MPVMSVSVSQYSELLACIGFSMLKVFKTGFSRYARDISSIHLQLSVFTDCYQVQQNIMLSGSNYLLSVKMIT